MSAFLRCLLARLRRTFPPLEPALTELSTGVEMASLANFVAQRERQQADRILSLSAEGTRRVAEGVIREQAARVGSDG